MHIFTELVGIQMLLMNTLEPLLRGEKLAQEQLAILFRHVQTAMATQAQELLAKRVEIGRNEHVHCSTMRKERIHYLAAARLALYTLGVFVVACILTGVFVFIRRKANCSSLGAEVLTEPSQCPPQGAA